MLFSWCLRVYCFLLFYGEDCYKLKFIQRNELNLFPNSRPDFVIETFYL